MEKITELLDKLENLGELIPKLDTLTGWVQWLVSLAVRVGPVCILVLGLIYLLIPPKEANRKFGYRTYFGMGSVMAWRFTQRIAGIIMIPVGLILTLIAYGTVAKFASMDLMTMAETAFGVIRGQVICVLLIYIFMFALTTVVFDRKGYCRFPNLTQTKIGTWLFLEDSILKAKKAQKTSDVPAEEVYEAPAEETYEAPVEEVYEVQGQQVITADDIVIEGLD